MSNKDKPPQDRWPKKWARPLYGPEVIARELIEAGKNLLKKVENDGKRPNKGARGCAG